MSLHVMLVTLVSERCWSKSKTMDRTRSPLRLESSLVPKEIILYTNENCLRLFTLCASGDLTCTAVDSLSKRITTLRYLDTQTNLSKRQMRWMETLQEYDCSIEYVQGKCNVVADALSRMADAPVSVLYTGEDEESEESLVAVNVLGTVSRPMLTRNMMKDLRQAYE
jgi:hypothetical protein